MKFRNNSDRYLWPQSGLVKIPVLWAGTWRKVSRSWWGQHVLHRGLLAVQHALAASRSADFPLSYCQNASNPQAPCGDLQRFGGQVQMCWGITQLAVHAKIFGGLAWNVKMGPSSAKFQSKTVKNTSPIIWRTAIISEFQCTGIESHCYEMCRAWSQLPSYQIIFGSLYTKFARRTKFVCPCTPKFNPCLRSQVAVAIISEFHKPN